MPGYTATAPFTAPDFSPDGTHVLTAGGIPNSPGSLATPALIVASLDGSGATVYPVSLPSNLEGIYNPTYSPDGQQVAFDSLDVKGDGNDALVVANADGTNPTVVLDDPSIAPQQPVWSPYGQRLAFIDNATGNLDVINQDGGGLRTVAAGIADTGSVYTISWLTDDTIAVAGAYGTYYNADTSVAVNSNLGAMPGVFARPVISQLQEYAPVLDFQADQLYTSDWVGEMTDVPGNYLSVSNAPAGTTYSGPALTLGLLAPPESDYNISGGYPVSSSDALHETDNYVNDYIAISSKAGYVGWIYGHTNVDTTGQTWLQYWTFYYYNDQDVAGIGDHEGDWEGIAIGLSPAGLPSEVIYNEHDGFSECDWESVPHVVTPAGRVATHVFVAHGSNASYPFAGVYDTPSGLVLDYAEGGGLLEDPSVFDMDTPPVPGWVEWPGSWGGSTGGPLPGEDPSPPGPSLHGQWNDEQFAVTRADACGSTLEVGLGSANRLPRPILRGVRARRAGAVVAVTVPAVPRGFGGPMYVIVTVRDGKAGRSIAQRRVEVRPAQTTDVAIPDVRIGATSEVVAELWARRGKQLVRSAIATRGGNADGWLFGPRAAPSRRRGSAGSLSHRPPEGLGAGS